MPRSRNIKPGFFTNEDLVSLPFATRLLFIGLWTLADREGRLEDRPKKIKMAVFPADDVDVDASLDLLHEAGFIQRYAVDGRSYIAVTNWARHQNPHKNEVASEIPPPVREGSGKIASPPEEIGTSTEKLGTSAEKLGSTRADSLCPDSLSPDSLSPDPLCADPPSPALPDTHGLAGQLSRLLRTNGVNATPSDPRLIALVEQGVEVDLVLEACQLANKAKPKGVALGYIVAILERWKTEASMMDFRGLKRTRTPANDRADFLRQMSGERHDDPDIIDIN